MSVQRGSVRVVLAAVVLLGPGLVASAQTDPRVEDLVGKVATGLEGGPPVHMVMDQQVLVNGAGQPQQSQEMWVRDMECFRMEMADGTVLVFTPEDIKLYIGATSVMVHIPADTLQQLGDDRAKALQAIGIGEPAPMIRALVESKDALTIVDEDAIGGEECWLLAVGQEAYPIWQGAFSGLPEGSVFTAVEVSLGKESGVFRGLHLRTTGPVQIELYVTVPELEEEVEVTDEMLTFEAPEGATIVEWTPDKTPEQVQQEFQQANAAGAGR